MINPSNITNFNRTEAELEEFALFCPAVAGKTAKVQAEKLDQLLENLGEIFEGSPFDLVRKSWESMTLEDRLRQVKLGKYSMLVPCYRRMSWHDAEELLEMSPDELKQFPGVGDKTARFFLMHAKEDANVATLDTHILKWMSEKLGAEVPDGTPDSEEYKRLEKMFLEEANRRDRHPAHLDLEIWNQYSV